MSALREAYACLDSALADPPCFDEDGIRLYNADCMKILLQMPDESVDIVVTSPPYNMGLSPGGGLRPGAAGTANGGMYKPGPNSKGGRFRGGYEDHDDAMPYPEYCAWQRSVLTECWRVARFGIFYNHRPRVEHGLLRMPLDWDFGGLPVGQLIVWDRHVGVDVSPRRFCTVQEWIILFAKPAFKLASLSVSGSGDVWRMPIARGSNYHPAPFPAELPGRCIAATDAQSVLDPFAGSSTTLVAAMAAGIEGIGIEKSAKYCQMSVRRLELRGAW